MSKEETTTVPTQYPTWIFALILKSLSVGLAVCGIVLCLVAIVL